ncbi:cytochrome P450 monooxygenase [Tricladium varicosporioides]|nr:cytochrome P450 monooxygenase [Hymenoscyphus varicosporioides]
MTRNIWPVAVLIGTWIWLSFQVWNALLSPVSRIPGPWYTKYTGFWLIKHEFCGSRRNYIHQLHVKYGPIVRLSPSEVSFTSAEAIKEIYTSVGSGYDKTEFYTLFKQFDTRTMFSTLWRGNHSQKKRHIANSYSNTNVMRREVIGGIEKLAVAFVKKCEEFKDNSMDAYVYLHCYALDCASHHFFHPYGTDSISDPEDFKMMEELSYHESLKSNLLLHYFPTLTGLINKIIKPRPSPISNNYVLDTCKKSDLGPHTLLHTLQNAKEPFTHTQIAAECMDHLAAGIDTTGDALTFLMYQLSMPSESATQHHLYLELTQNPSKSFNDLPYLDAIVKESLRLFPPIPMSQPRYVPPGGRTIDSVFIPGGTVVGCQAWSVHRLDKNIWRDAEEFVPERWVASGSEAVASMNRLFFAFGAGARGCTGRHLAIAEIKILLREVYSRFRTRISPDMMGSMEMSDQIISSRPRDQTSKLMFDLREDIEE